MPCVLKDITLEPDGNIIANYSGDAFNEENKDLFIGNVLTAFLNMDIEDQDMITDAIKDYQYTTSPKGLASMLKMASEMELMMFLSITFPLPEATCEMIAGRSSFITILPSL